MADVISKELSMPTTYSTRRADGTVAYYDSEEAMYADHPQPGLFDFSFFWAFIGCLAFVLIGMIALYGFHLCADWPKWAHGMILLFLAAVGTCIVGRLGQLMFGLFIISLGLAILGAVLWGLWGLL